MREITSDEIREAASDLDTADKLVVLFSIMSRTNSGRQRLIAALTLVVGLGVMAYNIWGWSGVEAYAWTLMIATIILAMLIFLPRPK